MKTIILILLCAVLASCQKGVSFDKVYTLKTEFTVQQDNVQRYEVQTSEDGVSFRSINTFQAATTPSGRATYTKEMDITPKSTQLYVRIKSVDYDDAIGYSPTQVVSIK